MRLTRDSSPGYMTNWAARLFARELERQLRPSGIMPAYMPVIFALSDGGALTQKALARIAVIEQPTMAATLNRMERDGFIKRRPDPGDGRSALIALTPFGLERIGVVEKVVQSINALAFAPLEPEERAQFMGLIGKIITALDAQDQQAPSS